MYGNYNMAKTRRHARYAPMFWTYGTKTENEIQVAYTVGRAERPTAWVGWEVRDFGPNGAANRSIYG
jgi:hypothetical protein